MGCSFRLAARVLLYVPSHRQDSTYHGLCYTSCGALAGMRNSSMGPPRRIDPMTHHKMSEHSYHRACKYYKCRHYLICHYTSTKDQLVKRFTTCLHNGELEEDPELENVRELRPKKIYSRSLVRPKFQNWCRNIFLFFIFFVKPCFI